MVVAALLTLSALLVGASGVVLFGLIFMGGGSNPLPACGVGGSGVEMLYLLGAGVWFSFRWVRYGCDSGSSSNSSSGWVSCGCSSRSCSGSFRFRF